MFDIDTFRAWIKTHFVRKRDLNLLMGQWTPALTFGGASTGITYTTQHGLYTRVGDLVFLECDIRLSSKGSATGNAVITGLPFPVKTNRAIAWPRWINMATAFVSIYTAPGSAGDSSLILVGISGASVSHGGVLDNTHFANNTQLMFNLTYRVN